MTTSSEPTNEINTSEQTADRHSDEFRSVWPKVIGIVCIVFGVLGLLTSAWGTYTALFDPGANAMGLPTDAAKQDAAAVFERLAVPSATLGIAGVLAALILLVVGIAMMRRHQDTASVARTWAFGKIVIALGNAWLGLRIMAGMEGVMREHMPEVPGFVYAIQRVFVFVGFGWTILLPVFLLIWFARRSIREEIVGWD